MDESAQIPNSQPGGEPERLSLTDRLTDVFFSPNRVFDSLKNRPPAVVNWLLPMILSMVITSTSLFLLFSQPAIIQTIRDGMDKSFEPLIAQGKMTTDKAEQTKEMGIKVMKIATPIGGLASGAAQLFIGALISWLVARWGLRVRLDYVKAMELTGLVMLISLAGMVVKTWLCMSHGDMLSTVGPALFLEHRDSHNKFHVMLSQVDLFQFWSTGVCACGLSRLCGTSWVKPAVWLYGIWALLALGSSALAR